MKKRLANKIRATVFSVQNFDSNYQPYSKNQQLKSMKNYFADIIAPQELKNKLRKDMEDMMPSKVSMEEYKIYKRVSPFFLTVLEIDNEKKRSRS